MTCIHHLPSALLIPLYLAFPVLISSCYTEPTLHLYIYIGIHIYIYAHHTHTHTHTHTQGYAKTVWSPVELRSEPQDLVVIIHLNGMEKVLSCLLELCLLSKFLPPPPSPTGETWLVVTKAMSQASDLQAKLLPSYLATVKMTAHHKMICLAPPHSLPLSPSSSLAFLLSFSFPLLSSWPWQVSLSFTFSLPPHTFL